MPRVVDAGHGVQIELALASNGGNVLFAPPRADPAAGDIVGQVAKCLSPGSVRGWLRPATGLDAVVKTTEFVTPAGLDDYRKTADVRREAVRPAVSGR